MPDQLPLLPTEWEDIEQLPGPLLPTEWEDIEQLPGPRLTKRIHDMYKLHGRGPAGARCKSCVNFYALHYAGTYFKCKLVANTGGPASDWRANWQACGKYAQREEEQP